MEDAPQFSVIKFFKAFEAELKKIDEYPLSIADLHIHRDAFGRLGGEELIGYDTPFARLYFLAGRDDELSFGVMFFETRFILNIDDFIEMAIPYGDVFDSEVAAAKELVGTLGLMANGGIRAVYTIRDGRNAALEVVLRKQDSLETLMTLLLTPRHLIRSKDDPESYETVVRANSFNVKPTVERPDFITSYLATTDYPQGMNRKVEGPVMPPLTGAELSRSIEEAYYSSDFTYAMHDPTGYGILKRPEFYLSFILLVVAGLGLSSAHVLPHTFIAHPLMTVLISSILAGFLSVFIHQRIHWGGSRKVLQQAVPPHKTKPRFDTARNKRRLQRSKKLELSFGIAAGLLFIAAGLDLMLTVGQKRSLIILGLVTWLLGVLRLAVNLLAWYGKLPFETYKILHTYLYVAFLVPFVFMPESDAIVLVFFAIFMPVPGHLVRQYFEHKEYENQDQETPPQKSKV